MSKKIIPILIISGLIISSCDSGKYENRGAMLGTVGGAIIGSQFGRGSGSLVGMGVGALLGSMIGSSIGKDMDKKDRSMHMSASQNALENVPDGKFVAWRNPNNGHEGYVTPVKTYQKLHGEYCREFQQVVKINGQDQTAYGTACRKPDGSWEVVSN